MTAQPLAEPDWDCEIDTPASILVIGGGPAAIEAALYARFLGYSVLVAMSRRIGNHLLPRDGDTLPEAWGVATSSLGLAALEAQGNLPQFDPQDSVTYQQYVEEYLIPVAKTDLLYDAIQINSPVVSVSRTGCLPGTACDIEARADAEFRVLIDSRSRGEYSQLVDIVLDCSGLEPVSGMASGGGLAVGQRAAQAEIRDSFNFTQDFSSQAGQRLVLLGDGHAAHAAILAYADGLENEQSAPQLTWIIPKTRGASMSQTSVLESGLGGAANDRLQQLRSDPPAGLAVIEAWGIESIVPASTGQGWRLRVQVREEETLDMEADAVAHYPSAQPSFWFTTGLAVAGSNSPGFQCLTAEPHYYLLGSKAVAAANDAKQWQAFQQAPCSVIRQQIRDVFGLIGGRRDLDLYATVRPQAT